MKKGLKKVSVLLTPEHYTALRDEATKRAVREGGLPDASAILRELVEKWITSTKPKGKG